MGQGARTGLRAESLNSSKGEWKVKRVCFAVDALKLPLDYTEPTASKWIIRLTQTGVDRFSVNYGADQKTGLSYGDAATKLGAAIMHALACEGKLDNREKGER
jgi:hypothetical protein